MLENYYKNGAITTDAKTQRLIAVQAALEIAKASVSAAGGDVGFRKTDCDLEYVTKHISGLADAVQKALETK